MVQVSDGEGGEGDGSGRIYAKKARWDRRLLAFEVMDCKADGDGMGWMTRGRGRARQWR